jgi:hypothetical protein
MRLSDAGLRRRKTRLIYPNHRPSPWLNEYATPRSLEPIVRRTARSVTCGRPNATMAAHLWHSKPISALAPILPLIVEMPSAVLVRTQRRQLIGLRTKQPKLPTPAMK